MSENYIYHHGIQGQKWGIRRYQDKNGILTSEGRERYKKYYKETGKKVGLTVGRTSKSVVKSIGKTGKETGIAIGKTGKSIGKTIAENVRNTYRDLKTGDPRYKRALILGAIAVNGTM